METSRWATMLAVGSLVVVASCTSDDADSDFEIDFSQCQVKSSSLTLRGSGAQPASPEDTGTRSDSASTTYRACRVRYSASSRVITWQIAPSTGSGTWMSPGSGWINLSLSAASFENSTLEISSTVSELPASVDPNEIVVSVAASQSGRAGARGSVTVGTNLLYPRSTSAYLDATFENVSVVGGGGATSLSGVISLAAMGGGSSGSSGSSSSSSSSGGSSGSSGGCSDNGASCKQPTSGCENGSMRACYCAAALTYKCFLDHGCYKEAGAATSVTRASLVSGCQSSNSQAMSLGGGACTACN